MPLGARHTIYAGLDGWQRIRNPPESAHAACFGGVRDFPWASGVPGTLFAHHCRPLSTTARNSLSHKRLEANTEQCTVMPAKRPAVVLLNTETR